MKKTFLFFLLLLLPLYVFSEDEIYVDGIYYHLVEKAKIAKVAGMINNPFKKKKIIIPESITYNDQTYTVTSIEDYAFNGNLTQCEVGRVFIPHTIIEMGYRVFDYCSIDTLEIQDIKAWCNISFSVEVNTASNPISKAKHLLIGGEDIKQLVIPEGVENISKYAFWACRIFNSVKLPSSLTSIGESSFAYCYSLQNVVISSIESWLNISYKDYLSNPLVYAHHLYLDDKEITDLEIPNSISFINDYSFENFQGLKSISLPNSITGIGNSAFSGCSGLTDLKIPSSVSSIGSSAFMGCTGLISIDIPNSVLTIGKSAFQDCSGLKTIIFPDNISIIPNMVLYNCTKLSSITLGNNTTFITEYAFRNCPELANVYCSSYKVPKTNSEAFIDSYIDYATLYVRKSLIDEYSSVEPWKNFKEIVNMPNYTLTYILDGVTYKIYEIEKDAIITPETAPTKEGYSFSGWSEIPETMPAHDVTVTGTFSLNKYKLVYKVDGVEYKSCDIEYGAAITPEAAPTKEGYSFSGWSEIPETMPAHDVTVTGTFSINKYKLVYKVDGVEYKNCDIEYGAAITAEPAPTKEGYTFSGWSDIPETMPAKDVTITGSFTINKYKLVYMVDGVEYRSYEVEFGAAITSEAEPTKEYYTFSGWSEIPETMPAHDVTVTGTFSPNKYKLIYKVDGEEYKSYDVEYGATITAETAPTKEGYTFSGWSDIPETMPAQDVTITGSFTINKYKLVYMVDGVEYKSYEVEFETAITPEAEPTKEYYTFSGWSEIPETMPAKDVTVTGTFSINKYKLVYKVDGEEYKSYEIEYGAAITPEPAPTKEGYTFSGWSEIPETMPAHDVTVEGSYSINKYKLVYMVDGVEYKSYEVEFGTAITPEAEPTKEYYTFSGWSEIPETMPAKDVTITGSFSINKYKLVYKVDGEEYKSYDVEYGTAITPEPSPTKEGYTFSGWSTIPETMPAEDVTVTGTFAVNKYKLVYKVDGAEYKSYEIEYGKAITAEPVPSKEGYTFSGWSEIPETMPAHDVTITGTFSINKYKLVYMVDGEVYKSYDVEYGATITAETAPTKEGFEFSGWSDIPETMPANDVTVTGTFKAIVKADDGTIEVSGGEASVTGGETATGDVDIPESVSVNGVSYPVTTISDGAYQNNANITSATIPESVTTIGANAFNGCSNLGEVNVGKSVSNIGSKAFANLSAPAAARRAKTRGASGLVIKCYATSVPTTAADAFENTSIGNATLLVDDNSVAAYKSASPWSGFGTIMGFSEATGINGVLLDNGDHAKVFSIDGKPLNTLQKGINIIHMDNGKTKKVLVR